mmetsp:Transcript_12117/g.31311  ORF Transcript_12117/g.31311 Transcript_12117/m.31311 type:complete len:225 (-) Transcript_12117:603-1277(-)
MTQSSRGPKSSEDDEEQAEANNDGLAGSTRGESKSHPHCLNLSYTSFAEGRSSGATCAISRSNLPCFGKPVSMWSGTLFLSLKASNTPARSIPVAKGGQSSSNTIKAAEKTSALAVACAPPSGAMYAGVPTVPRSRLRPIFSSLDRPRSPILSTSSWVMNTFWGLISRWTTETLCMSLMPFINCFAKASSKAWFFFPRVKFSGTSDRSSEWSQQRSVGPVHSSI